MRLPLLHILITISLLSLVFSDETTKKDGHGNAPISDYPFEKEFLAMDRETLKGVGQALKVTGPGKARELKGIPKFLFDGRYWKQKGNSKSFEILVRKQDQAIPVNRDGNYLIWRLPSSEKQKGRDRVVGVFWPKGKEPKVFFGQLSIFDAER